MLKAQDQLRPTLARKRQWLGTISQNSAYKRPPEEKSPSVDLAAEKHAPQQ
jgi:hypothetical protein